MKKGLFFIFYFITSIVFSQTIKFQKVFGGGGDDHGRSVRQTTDGGYIVAGYSTSFSSSNDAYLIKTDMNGDTIWTKTFIGPSTSESASCVRQTTDGGYIIVGSFINSGKGDVLLIKTNSNGNYQWSKLFGDINDYDGGGTVEQTSDGGYIISGTTGKATSFSNDVYLIKTDMNGDSLWTRKLGRTGYDDSGACVRQTSDGGYIIAGETQYLSAIDAYIIKTDSNGDTLWTKIFGGTKTDYARSVQQTIDGGYILTGTTWSIDTTMGQLYLIKTDSNGDTLWTKGIINANSIGSNGFAVQQTADGGYIATGCHMISGQMPDAYLVKTNSNGDTLWTKVYGDAGPQYECGFYVQQTTDGGYIMVGETEFYPPLNTNVYLVKTDSLGNTSPLVGVQEQEKPPAQEIAIYPNPFSTQANLVLPGEVATNGEAELVIYDVLGNETARVKITAQQALIQRDNLKAGLYFCRVVKENTVIATGKFIIQ